eukprot:5578726-Prymnesium_polylepis.1
MGRPPSSTASIRHGSSTATTLGAPEHRTAWHACVHRPRALPCATWCAPPAHCSGNQSHGLFCALKDVLQNTSRSGGHAIRFWLHVEGDHTPVYNSSGYVVAGDVSGSLIADMRRYLRAAAELDVLVFFCLWNGAVLRNANTKGLFASPARLRSYIDT